MPHMFVLYTMPKLLKISSHVHYVRPRVTSPTFSRDSEALKSRSLHITCMEIGIALNKYILSQFKLLKFNLKVAKSINRYSSHNGFDSRVPDCQKIK